MRSKGLIAAAALGLALAPVAWAQETTTQRSVTMQTPGGETVTITGPVVRYTPGRTIVLRGSDNREMTYTLSNITVPPDLEVGRTVTIYTEPGPGGTTRVTRVVTTASGDTTTTTSTTSDLQGEPDDFVTVSGTVQAYEPGRSITIVHDGTPMTYTINSQSQLPPQLVTGKTVTVRTTKVTSGSPIVQKVTYTTTTKSTTIKR